VIEPDEVEIINLTGHSIVLTSDTDLVVLQGDQPRAHISSTSITERRLRVRDRGLIVPVLSITEQEIVDLPSSVDGVVYVTSGIVAAVANQQGRKDVLSPGRTVRSRNGRVESARALIRIERKM
jgi:hypothetical protein